MLSVHNGHGHTNFDRFMPTCRVLLTCEVLRGQTSVGLYFSANWCAPCAGFTPILTTFYKKRKKLGPERSPFEAVIASRCKTKANTEQYYSNMPWTAMAHKDSMGSRGQELMAKFGGVTIPALVLLDGMGVVTCRDG